jgi:hypothetical protein
MVAGDGTIAVVIMMAKKKHFEKKICNIGRGVVGGNFFGTW